MVRFFLIAIITILTLSIVGMSLWLFEILKIKGWYSLNWLSGPLYSPFISALMVSFSFVTPFIISKQTVTKKILISVTILYAVNILCFEVGKQLCYSLYCRFCFWATKDIVYVFLITLILFAFLGLTYWFVTNKLIKKNKKINMLIITLSAMLTIPLSLLTISINTGFGIGTDWVDAVKMGYPIFWMSLLLGLSGLLLTRQDSLISTNRKDIRIKDIKRRI